MNLFLKKMLYFAYIPLLIISANFFIEKIDILQIMVNQAANQLISGYNVASAYTLGCFSIKEAYAKASPSGKDVLAFGSSRSFEIKEHFFPGKSFFNMGSVDAKLEDFIYLYLLWRERGLKPSYVMLALDDWIFNDRGISKFREFIINVFAEANIPISIEIPSQSQKNDCEHMIEIAERLISIDLFRNNLLYILNHLMHGIGLKGFNIFYPTKDSFANAEVMVHDGSINYGLVRRSRTVNEVDRLITEKMNSDGFMRLKDFTKFNHDKLILFEAFVRLLMQDNVKIIFFLSPYHPRVYELLKLFEGYKMVCATRDYFIGLSKQLRIPIFGDYDPHVNNALEEDFFDDIHPKTSAMKKIFADLSKALS